MIERMRSGRIGAMGVLVGVLFFSGTAFGQGYLRGFAGNIGVTLGLGIACPVDGQAGYILGVQWVYEGYEAVIEGSEGELERIGEGPGEGIEGAGVEYRVIDYARDLMRGRFNDETARVASETAAGDRVNRKSRESVVEAAIGAYGLHLEEFPEDWVAVREMAVALLEARRVDDAVKLMYEAYEQNPELGIVPINGLILGKSKEPMRKLVVRAVNSAHRSPSEKGWLLVAVLMQSQDRQEVAMEMLDRAVELGLEVGIVRGFGVGGP